MVAKSKSKNISKQRSRTTEFESNKLSSPKNRRVTKVTNMEEPRKKKRTHHMSDYATFIRRLFKSIVPEFSLTKTSMNILNCFALDLLERLAIESGRLADYGQKGTRTLSLNDARTSVKLVVKGELQTNALAEGHRAVQKYTEEFKKIKKI